MSKYAHVVKLSGTRDEVCELVTNKIKEAGFGVLTRIDFDKTIKSKLDKDLKPCTILGACNPKLAYDAYTQTTDTALFIPCNISVTEVEAGQSKIEAMKPSQMLEMLPAVKMSDDILDAEAKLLAALDSLNA